MKKTLLLLTAALFAAGISAQNKISVEEIRPFTTLQANGKVELAVTINDSLPLSMRVDMNGNDPNLLKWWDTDGALQIKYSAKSKANPVIIRINCHRLTDLDLSGVSMTLETPWEESMVTISLSGSAKLTADIYAKDLKISAQTSATAVITGEGKYADFETRSKSVLDARNYRAESTTLRAAGYSESYVYAADRLIIDAVDGSSVFYRGTPEIFRERTSRSGHSNSIGQ